MKISYDKMKALRQAQQVTSLQEAPVGGRDLVSQVSAGMEKVREQANTYIGQERDTTVEVAENSCKDEQDHMRLLKEEKEKSARCRKVAEYYKRQLEEEKEKSAKVVAARLSKPEEYCKSVDHYIRLWTEENEKSTNSELGKNKLTETLEKS